MPTDELLEQPSKLNKSKKFSLLRKSEETLIVNVKYSMIDLILEPLTLLVVMLAGILKAKQKLGVTLNSNN